MLTNRSMPRSTVIPALAYPDIGAAIDWLCATFGFTLRLRIANHRAQLHVGDGAIVLTQRRGRRDEGADGQTELAHAVMVRVEDVHAHHERAKQRGARILGPPADYPYGECQYTVQDLGGHCWTFSQSIADVAPEDWGGTPGEL
jgi:uncharacterized glyoxalase superfamily protein PhnB